MNKLEKRVFLYRLYGQNIGDLFSLQIWLHCLLTVSLKGGKKYVPHLLGWFEEQILLPSKKKKRQILNDLNSGFLGLLESIVNEQQENWFGAE